MSKKHFIALAQAIIAHNRDKADTPFRGEHVRTIADFCSAQNPRFDHWRFVNFIAGDCGPNGGKR